MSVTSLPSRRWIVRSIGVRLAASVLGLSLVGPAASAAGLTFSVTIDDPTNAYAEFHDAIESHVFAAGVAWDTHIRRNASLEISVGFSTGIPRATGRSITSSFVENNGVYNVFEQGAAAEARTAIDPNGDEFDIEIMFNPEYLADELWFDPEPTVRTAPPPDTRTDAMSVFLHELGHAFAFSGWRDPFTGELPGDYASPFDLLTYFDGSHFYFDGPATAALYGSPAPLTYGNYHHFGNEAPEPGSDLIPDLMNGVVFYHGSRYDISALDLALFRDVGVPLLIPGDMNDDGAVDNEDISPFVLALVDEDAYRVEYPILDPQGWGDVSGDGLFDNEDIAPFVALLLGAPAAVPEPGTILLLANGAIAIPLVGGRARSRA
jgi:hypothetical protein